MSGDHVARGGATRSVPAPCESTTSKPAETRSPRLMLPSHSWYVRPAGGCGRPDTTSVPPPRGSQRSCPRAFVAAPTGTSEITRAPAVGRAAPGSVRALRSFGAVAEGLEEAARDVRSPLDGGGSVRRTTFGAAGSGARLAGGGVAAGGDAAGAGDSGARVAGAAGFAPDGGGSAARVAEAAEPADGDGSGGRVTEDAVGSVGARSTPGVGAAVSGAEG